MLAIEAVELVDGIHIHDSGAKYENRVGRENIKYK